jgi:hypothetical protein
VKHYILAVEPLDGEEVQITITCGWQTDVTVYAVIAVDERGAGIVDSGYRSIYEAQQAWPEAIPPSPAVCLTPSEADKQAIEGTTAVRKSGR